MELQISGENCIHLSEICFLSIINIQNFKLEEFIFSVFNFIRSDREKEIRIKDQQILDEKAHYLAELDRIAKVIFYSIS